MVLGEDLFDVCMLQTHDLFNVRLYLDLICLYFLLKKLKQYV